MHAREAPTEPYRSKVAYYSEEKVALNPDLPADNCVTLSWRACPKLPTEQFACMSFHPSLADDNKENDFLGGEENMGVYPFIHLSLSNREGIG